jgi:hypothetical protein
MDAMANGIYVPPEQSRLRLEEALSKFTTDELLKTVGQYEVWKKTGDFTLTYTIAQDLWQSLLEKENPNKIYGPLQVYDAIARELARRLLSISKPL